MERLRQFAYFLFLLLPVSSFAAEQGYYSCARNPQFLSKTGLTQPVGIDTAQSRFPGVVIRELRGQQRVYRHPSWGLSGSVSATVRDELGNIYAIPTPNISLAENPMQMRNYIYRIDGETGEMSVFSELPASPKPSQINPFGTMGIAYDCSRRILYVSTIADSDYRTQKGAIYAINVNTKAVTPILRGRDVLGIEVFNTGKGKRLYFGDARSSSVYSFPITSDPHLNKQNIKHEFSLLNLKQGSSSQISKIRFSRRSDQYLMRITNIDFDYRLLSNQTRQTRRYEFRFDQKSSSWREVSAY